MKIQEPKLFKNQLNLLSAGQILLKSQDIVMNQSPEIWCFLHAHCMVNAKFENNNKIAYVLITNKDMEKFHAKNDYTEGIVEELRRMATTEVSFVLKEVDENTTKASLRSKTIDVSNIAGLFGGAGIHLRPDAQ